MADGARPRAEGGLFTPPGGCGKLAGMRRRRLMLVGLVALTAIGLWVAWGNRLSEEERKFIGTWYGRQRSSDGSGGALVVLDFAPERTCRVDPSRERIPVVLRWGVRDGKLIVTVDRSVGLLDRVRGLLPAFFPGAVALERHTYSRAADRRRTHPPGRTPGRTRQ